MKISILLVNNRTWYGSFGSALIRYVEGTGFSHTALLLEHEGANYVYHATWPKAKRESISGFQETHKLYKKYDFELDQDPLVVYNYLQIMVGRQYSLAQLLLIYLRRTSSFIHAISGGWILNHEHILICSELNAAFLNDFMDYRFQMKLDSVGLREIEIACESLK